MKKTNKKRRSERVNATHRLLLSVRGSTGAEILKEIVTTTEISRHGACIRGRRVLEPDWMGVVIQLSSCRQVPFRVAWQTDSTEPGQLDTGIEILESTDFWGRSFSGFSVNAEAHDISIENAEVTPMELMQELRAAERVPGGEKLLETLWCGLIEQLEERRVFTRAELVATLRKIGFQAKPR